MVKEQKKVVSATVSEEYPIKGLAIEVESLENIIGKTLPFNVSVQVEYMGQLLGESPEVLVQSEVSNPVDFKTIYKIHSEFVTTQHLDEFTAHPIVFTVLYRMGETEVPVKAKGTDKGSASKSSKKTSGKASKKSGKSASPGPKQPKQSTNILGSANLDVLPLLLGEPIIKEILMLEDTTKKTGSEVKTWTNLPKLNVNVTGIEDTLNDVKPSNILHITLESLYNVMPEMKNTIDCEVVTVLPLFERSGEEVDLENLGMVRFTDGVLTSCPVQDTENMKRWFGLSTVTGRSALSKYRLKTDPRELKDTLKLSNFQLNLTLNSTQERLEWNLLRRCWLEASAQEEFFKKLVKYHCWPLEFKFETKSAKKDKKEPKSKSNSRPTQKKMAEKSEMRFVAFLDLSNLLYPGVSSTHVTSQLYTYIAKDVIDKWGEELFPAPPVPPTSLSAGKGLKSAKTVSSKNNKESEETSKKGKKGKSPNKEKEKKAQSEIQETPVEEEIAIPLVAENGMPVFVTVEVELMHPLVKKKTVKEILKSVLHIIPEREFPEPQVVAATSAVIDYEKGISRLISYIDEQYQDFYSYEEIEDDSQDTRFFMHLHGSGAYSKMSATVKQIAMTYIEDKIGFPSKDISEESMQCYISDVFVKLVEEMNRIVYTTMDEVDLEVKTVPPVCTVRDYYYFAVEATEQGNIEKANEYFTKMLAHSKGIVPEYWLDYAIFQLKICDYEKATECVHEAVSLDTRHHVGLLLYALLAWYTEDFEVAELFFTAVTEFHPRYYQAWICFHLFAEQIEKKEMADIALMNGLKTIEDLQNKIINNSDTSTEHKYCLLSWCPGFEGDHKPFTSTAILLLKLGFPEFAETCLARKLLIQGPTVPFLYYLAVSHYMQGRYEDSLSHIEQALCLDWKDVRLWSLKGHNLYKLEREADAQEAYKFVLDSENDIPNDLHLIHLRMGQFLLNEGNYETAKEMFLQPCQLSPTPLVWLGLGMASYMLEQLDDAELSLTEANMLDPTLTDVWMLLALVNMKRCRFKIATHCEYEAIRLGSADSPLSEELKELKASIAPCCSSS